MSDKLSISYHTAKRILLELLENNDFSTDEDILKILGSVIPKRVDETNNTDNELSRIIIDKDGRIFLPDYSSSEVKMPYLPKTVFIFFLIHKEGVEFKSMYNYMQELHEIYQIVALEKNTEASKIRRSLSMVVPESLMEMYCIMGKRGEKHRIKIDSLLIEVGNKKLEEIFELEKHR